MKKNTQINKPIFKIKEVIFIVLISTIITSITTGIIMYNQNKLATNISYVDLNQDENLKEFVTVYANLLSDYYEDIDKKEMLESAIGAMFEYLGEDYTTYLNKEQTENLTEKLQGEYEGIGISVIDGNIVYEVFEDTPASKAGLQPNDIIIKIDEEPITEENKNDVVNKIKERGQEEIKLTVKRENEIKEFTLQKEKIISPATATNIFEENNKKIGYLYIDTFSQNIETQVEKSLKKLEEEKIDSLIIDLRGNTGGYLEGANKVASLFLEKGKKIYSLQEKESFEDFYDETSTKRDYPIVVLTNGASASASEILTAALKESYGAIQVGTTTYGKGKVQQTKNLTDGSMIKYTSAKWLTPNGECIDGVGIKPDYEIEIEIDEEAKTMIDTQLPKAIEILSK